MAAKMECLHGGAQALLRKLLPANFAAFADIFVGTLLQVRQLHRKPCCQAKGHKYTPTPTFPAGWQKDTARIPLCC